MLTPARIDPVRETCARSGKIRSMPSSTKLLSANFTRALEALKEPKNEPLRWLLGRALEQHAGKAGRHFLLDALASGRPSNLVAWNAKIHHYRTLLENPDVATQKAEQDLRSDGGKDAEDKLRSVYAEIVAVIKLSGMGYKRFKVLLPGPLPTPDFEAEDPEGKPTRVEVKNLQEPEDLVRTVAIAHWRQKFDSRPDRYNFKAVLTHSHRAALSSAARKRLRSLIDILPDTRRPLDEVLDGGVRVRLERAPDYAARVGKEIFLELSGKDKPGLMVSSGITADDLVIQTSEVQSLFLKALRRVAESTDKFFREAFAPESDRINVVALHWEPPDPLVSEGMMEFVHTKIGNLFSDFQLPLRVVIFVDPEIGWDLIKQYR